MDHLVDKLPPYEEPRTKTDPGSLKVYPYGTIV